MNGTLRLAHVVEQSGIYGPGCRYVIWLQGCSIRCPGCWNHDLWSPHGGRDVAIGELLGWIAATPEIEGVTILGGEPLDQADVLLGLIGELRHRDLSVFLYTGFELGELVGSARSCFEASDIVVTGRYIAALRDESLAWRGSTNQTVHFLTPTYRGVECGIGQTVEVQLDAEGSMTVIGYPDAELLRFIANL